MVRRRVTVTLPVDEEEEEELELLLLWELLEDPELVVDEVVEAEEEEDDESDVGEGSRGVPPMPKRMVRTRLVEYMDELTDVVNVDTALGGGGALVLSVALSLITVSTYTPGCDP